MIKESEIVRSTLALLRHRKDCFFWRNNTGAMATKEGYIRFGLVGSADIIGVLRGGQFCAIELKTLTGKLTPAQVAFGDTIKNIGGVYIVARSTREAISSVNSLLLDHVGETRGDDVGSIKKEQ